MKNNNIDIFDEEESNIHIIQLEGKIVRKNECPLKKKILCEECEFHDGWSVDAINYKVHIFCTNPNIIDSSKLTLLPIKKGEKDYKKRRS